MAKLGIAIGVIRSLLGFAIALEAIAQLMKNLRDLHVAGRMLLLIQFLGDGSRTFANPTQRRLRVSARLLINQPLDRLHQPRIGLDDGFAARSGPTIRPTNGLPLAWISRIPLRIALRDKPHARRTAETPP